MAPITRWITTWIVALVLCSHVRAQDPRYQLAIEVDLVNVTVTASDKFGRHLHNLRKEDFQVLEDGREQEISFFSQDQSLPVSLGVLIDISSSQKDKLEHALQAVREMAASLARDDEMFVITFNSTAEMRQRFTNSSREILRSLEGVKSDGDTAVHDAIAMGLREIQMAKNQKKILLVFTDGFDTRSRMSASEAERLLKEYAVLTYTFGIDDNPNVRKRTRFAIYYYMLDRWATAAGGRVIRLVAGDDQAARYAAQDLFAELRRQYTLSYYQPEPEHAGWRSIELRLAKPDAQLRYRSGYFAAGRSGAGKNRAVTAGGLPEH